MYKILVSDIMTREPLVISPNANLLECAKKMVKKKTGSLLLVEKKKLIGLISTQDILWALVKKSQKDLSSIQAKDISPKKIAVIKPSATLEEALKKMKKSRFERLPVIDNNELVGLITTKDILSFNPEIYPELQEFAEIREEARKLKLVKKAKEKKMSGFREGICEECGNYGRLERHKGMLICVSCKEA
ncbi:MAG: Inosine-5'-monophosphate dehydrogenase [Candidatus Diapherotrites archaeon ADurb.Bin253]|jgi:CBS domain-containing protein|nr:MAG: Inosine-5'-monophosphate dehydrogenase [Candidatus Diapherotrites archaeon ADurb.Bin253]HNZ51916.1 CBS domain-containing protein [Candidatus Pacearchaeota archaeon]HOC96936.1 CBS domain-containing protein [Candidatus Pacearchaeota archaeon]HOH04248.1 CBS domain-containing protein [Candidatus Pacearchaeota archaeon]HOR52038.1 CBS domain-containing protein [Candidatus Pacearchaeota archaeon]